MKHFFQKVKALFVKKPVVEVKPEPVVEQKPLVKNPTTAQKRKPAVKKSNPAPTQKPASGKPRKRSRNRTKVM